jgi:nicotinate-nucleotide adenylyltransferase
MRIGLYFGSFNPIHVGHLIIANHFLNETDLQKIWFIVSPHNPFKNESTLLPDYHRLHLVRLAIEEDVRMKASDIEFKLPKPSFTANTLVYLKEKYPNHEFFLIMGSDSFQNIDKWKNFESIIKKYPIYIYKRPGFEIKNHHHAKIQVLETPLLEISATQIRKLIGEGKSVRYLVPDKVWDEIEKGNYYRKPAK